MARWATAGDAPLEKIQEIIGQPIVATRRSLQKILDMSAPITPMLSQVSVERPRRAARVAAREDCERWQDVYFVLPTTRRARTLSSWAAWRRCFGARGFYGDHDHHPVDRFVAGIRTEVEKVEKNMNVFSDTLDEWLVKELDVPGVHLQRSRHSAPAPKRVEAVLRRGQDVQGRDAQDARKRQRDARRHDSGIFGKVPEGERDANFIKNLEEYLETKRMGFRGLFPLQRQLLEILAETKNVQAVQPHMSKSSMVSSPSTLARTPRAWTSSPCSVRGERVQLRKNLKARGNVEVVTAVEAAMVAALKKQGKESS